MCLQCNSISCHSLALNFVLSIKLLDSARVPSLFIFFAEYFVLYYSHHGKHILLITDAHFDDGTHKLPVIFDVNNRCSLLLMATSLTSLRRLLAGGVKTDALQLTAPPVS